MAIPLLRCWCVGCLVLVSRCVRDRMGMRHPSFVKVPPFARKAGEGWATAWTSLSCRPPKWDVLLSTQLAVFGLVAPILITIRAIAVPNDTVPCHRLDIVRVAQHSQSIWSTRPRHNVPIRTNSEP